MSRGAWIKVAIALLVVILASTGAVSGIANLGKRVGPFVTSDGRQYQLTNAQVDGIVEPDGLLSVTERITFRFDGTFRGAYRDIPLGEGEATDIEVLEGETPYAPGASALLGSDGAPGSFGTTVEADAKGKPVQRIVWHYRATDEERTFTVRYRLSKLVRAYDDVVDVYWKVWGSEWKGSLDRLTATLATRQSAPGDVFAYGHPGWVDGTVTIERSRVSLEAVDVPREQYVELRALLPRGVLNADPSAADVRPGPGLEAAKAEEKADIESTSASQDRVQSVARNPWLYAIFLSLIGVALGTGVLALAYRKWGREPAGVGSVQYYPEPPDDTPPALAVYLTRQANVSTGGDAMAATILDLTRRGRFVATIGGGKGGTGMSLRDGRDVPDMTRWEQQAAVVAGTLIRGAGGELDLADAKGVAKDMDVGDRTAAIAARSEFEAGVKGDADQFEDMFVLPWMRYLARILAGLVAALGVLAMILGAVAFSATPLFGSLAVVMVGIVLVVAGLIVLFSPRRLWVSTRPEYVERTEKWDGFRRYLDDIADLRDQQPASLALWDRLLIYATAFGSADEVARAARNLLPPKEATTTGGGPGYGVPWIWGGGMGGTGNLTANVALASAVSGSTLSSLTDGLTTVSATPSSSGGGGGGFGGSGGGGGGGGGGGAW